MAAHRKQAAEQEAQKSPLENGLSPHTEPSLNHPSCDRKLETDGSLTVCFNA